MSSDESAMSSAGAGRVMAQWIAAGEAPMDLWDMDIARFDRAANAASWLAARVTEAVGEVFQMHWPYRQASAGRGVRRSVLHDAFAAAGAVFGAPADLSNEAWPFAASRRIELAAASIRMTRLSFTGELGFELYIPVENAPGVYESIAGAGQALGLTHCGHLALDACRLEKGYRHWGYDIGPHDSPLEAGLGVAVTWDKPDGFIGRDALLARRRTGIERRLLQFVVAAAHPLLLHDEPVYRHGTLVGHTTSGDRGFRTGLSLCFAYANCDPDTPPSNLLGEGYEVGIAGERYPLHALARPAYNPVGSRMRT